MIFMYIGFLAFVGTQFVFIDMLWLEQTRIALLVACLFFVASISCSLCMLINKIRMNGLLRVEVKVVGLLVEEVDHLV